MPDSQTKRATRLHVHIQVEVELVHPGNKVLVPQKTPFVVSTGLHSPPACTLLFPWACTLLFHGLALAIGSHLLFHGLHLPPACALFFQGLALATGSYLVFLGTRTCRWLVLGFPADLDLPPACVFSFGRLEVVTSGIC